MVVVGFPNYPSPAPTLIPTPALHEGLVEGVSALRLPGVQNLFSARCAVDDRSLDEFRHVREDRYQPAGEALGQARHCDAHTTRYLAFHIFGKIRMV